MTPPDMPAQWASPVDLADMVGCKVLYVNKDAHPVVSVEAWLDGIDEGWAIIEFWDNSRATVRPSRIVGYQPKPTAFRRHKGGE